MLIHFTSLSAVDRESADSYMKLLLAFALSYDYNYDAQFRRKMTGWYMSAKPFMDRFKIKSRSLDKAYRGILAQNGPENDDIHDAIVDVFFELKELQPKFKKELDLKQEDLKFMNDMRLLVLKGSEAAIRNIGKQVSRFRDPDFNGMFVHEKEDTSKTEKELTALVKKHGNVPGMIMPTPVLEKWQEFNKLKGQKRPEHIQYLELTRLLRENFKKRLSSIVRTSGKPYLPVADVVRILDEEKIVHTVPKTFVGMIDDAGKYYTTAGLRLLQAPSGDVRMNPEYDPKLDNAYVCSFTPPFAKDLTRAYTEKYRSGAKESKFTIVLEALPHMNAALKKWRSAMGKPNTKAGKLATLAELIYETSARVSSKSAASAGERTYGATTLQVQHVQITDSVMNIKYIGKSGGRQHHIVRLTTQPLKRLAENLKVLMAGKKKTDPIFEDKEKAITGTMVTRYLRTLGLPAGFTVHKFRTIRATQMAQEVLKGSPFKKNGAFNEREVHQWVESAILKIGIELGHMSGDKPTANTAIQNYIQPEILADFYAKLGIRPSAKIQKAIDAASKHKEV